MNSLNTWNEFIPEQMHEAGSFGFKVRGLNFYGFHYQSKIIR
jgi:hypothetical protein